MKYQSLGDVLNKLVENLGIENQLLENKAIVEWPNIVGPKISKNSKAERIKDGILFVKTSNNVWKNELTFYKMDLIKKINSELGKRVVFDIILL